MKIYELWHCHSILLRFLSGLRNDHLINLTLVWFFVNHLIKLFASARVLWSTHQNRNKYWHNSSHDLINLVGLCHTSLPVGCHNRIYLLLPVLVGSDKKKNCYKNAACQMFCSDVYCLVVNESDSLTTQDGISCFMLHILLFPCGQETCSTLSGPGCSKVGLCFTPPHKSPSSG